MTSRLQRWGAFGLRGRIVGAVLVTTVVTLSVAAIVLLPQLEQSLRKASRLSLSTEIDVSAHKDIVALGHIDYEKLPLLGVTALAHTLSYRQAKDIGGKLADTLAALREKLGTPNVSLIGYVDGSGHGKAVGTFGAAPSAVAAADLGHDDLDDVTAVFSQRKITYKPYMTFGQLAGKQVVRAAIKLPNDAVLAVRKSIDEIPDAAKAVARSFEVAALAGLLLTGLLAIPLAATLARRLQRLREAAQRVAEEGAGAVVPTDRARDEVGDLSRSFAIMQRRLAHQEEARRAFVATSSHELRTPLASLEGMLELVADDLSEANPNLDEANALLERARAQSRRLSRLAADLLDLSRIDAEVPLRSEPVELSEIARAVLAEFELEIHGHGVRTTISGSEPAAWVRADPGKVAQILRILLDNALRVAPKGSEIAIELTDGGLTVIDHGPGVAAEERELIFERFKRGAATGGEAGFGLGLAIGRELARRMDGDLTLADSQPGATFTLLLPAAAPPDPAESDEPVGAARP